MAREVLPHVRQRLEEIEESLCDGFTMYTQRASLRVFGIDGEIHGEIANIDKEREVVDFTYKDGRSTSFSFSEIVGITT